ncbi:unnamed protein product [Cyberlindnera jadinii]|uniref:Mitochondrial genome maintenance protein MGM101 n=1 Tax=Cyberlindnera jadinii (strain ATCC 18201 / CBS 1600 / BCRC 20928 / JCM 3617 / NBRC 0987 / NRRL Y-1542) TaxID=983966 RepID=A0A0H5C2Q5_CYBJN|nr:Mgm101p-domain-containing protein [Cyberlindnera jadinii NRRL Y-1542]ODV72899.1 Mgm101p-domain-containing protein [Cyberlindnera jadinii NRRL Y-1542]CEP22086.1 unnamed protein product [Cyberlindnera jadinii]
MEHIIREHLGRVGLEAVREELRAMIYRPVLIRSVATSARKVAAKPTSTVKAASRSTPSAAATRTVKAAGGTTGAGVGSRTVPVKAKVVEEEASVEEDLPFNPPEFNLQVGQSQRDLDTKPSGLKSKKLDDLFRGTLHDNPEHDSPAVSSTAGGVDIPWSTSYYGLGSAPFSKETQELLSEKVDVTDIEIKPDGLIYLPEIKYRRILNRAFGAGGWGLVPRSETFVTDTLLTREYGLICMGRLVSIARGEQDYFSQDGIPTATEGCKSNALMRCCKDLGIASELWDPNFIRMFKKEYCDERFVEHVSTKRKRKMWKRKDRTFDYPYKVC